MNSLFSKIKREHLLKAIKEIDETGIRKGRQSSKYDLIYNGREYPPKLVISIAARFVSGIELDSKEFKSGDEKPSFEFLRSNQFEIKPKPMKEEAKLTDYLKEYSKSDELKQLNRSEFDDKMNYFKTFFTADHLKTIEWPEIQELGSNLWCMSKNPIAKGRAFGKPNAEISKYSKTFEYLVRGKESDTIRINNCLKNDQYRLFGISDAAVTEILAYVFPEKYCIDNNRSRFSLRKLNIELKQDKKESYGDYFVRYNDRIANIIVPAYNQIVKPTHGLPAMIAIDQFFSWLYSNYGENENVQIEELEINEESPMELIENKLPLNSILFGPPGTGKTFGTMEYSVRIIENLSASELSEKYKTREEIRTRYLKYVNDKQISFTTFHQSFSYEDFIEGIKPVMPSEIEAEESDDLARFSVGMGDDENKLQYHIEPGIFKLISEEARSYNTFVSKGVKWIRRPSEKEINSVQFFKMSLGNTLDVEDNKIYNYCIKEGCIALGYGDDIDFTGVKNRADIITRYRENQVVLKDKNDFRVSAVERFMFWMKENDLVLISLGNHRLRAVGRIMKEGYYFNPNSGTGYNQFRNVEWLMVGQEVPVAEVYQKGFSQQTIYVMYDDKIKKEFFTGDAIKVETDQTKRNHVLIIDEINRGNIANIFGELITLIEDDKREGEVEALSVKLPYSKKQFSVPSNLFLIGTMNTADKSVEALDAALRRRFTFIETPPEPNLINYMGERVIYHLYAKHAKLPWKDKKWILIENDLTNLIINKESYPALAEDYESLPGKKSELPPTWNLALVIQMCNTRGIEFIDFQKMLTTINNRIEKLLDKDHKIGHAFFINLYKSDFPFTELKSIFLNKILPLLQEYFFGDHGKIGLVLGDSFVVKHIETNTDYRFAKFKGYDEDTISELKERAVFKFTDSITWTTETFTSIYQ